MKKIRIAGIAAVLILLLTFPLVADANLVSLAVTVLLLTSAVAAWNIFSGYTGYITLGNATYYGCGAYVLALVCQSWHITGGWGPFLLFPLAGLFCAAIAMPLGWIALRVQRYTFLVLTLAIFFLFQSLAYNLGNITGGSMGIYLPLPDWSGDLFNIPFYYTAGAVLLFVTILSWRIRSSKFGLELLALRDDEERARGLGVRTGQFKLASYSLSAALFGVVGAINVYFQGSVSPSIAFDPILNLTVVVACFLGGIGTVAGPIVGGVLLVSVQSYLIQQFGATITGLDQILLGGFLLAILLLLPEGIVPGIVHLLGLVRFYQRSQVESNFASPALVTADRAPLEVVLGEKEQVRFDENGTKEPVYIGPFPPMDHAAAPFRSGMILQRTRTQRLTALGTEGAGKARMQRETIPVGSWRCPKCRKPFLLRGETCYCPRCGLSRSIGPKVPQSIK